MRKLLMFNGNRTGYSPDQCRSTMTVNEMIDYLQGIKEDYGGNTDIYICNDNGYTYGSFSEGWMAVLEGSRVIEIEQLEGDEYNEFWQLVEDDMEDEEEDEDD